MNDVICLKCILLVFLLTNDSIDCGATDSHNIRLSHILAGGKLDNPSFFIRVVPLHIYAWETFPDVCQT